jgi:7-cyano-7-deazaguanine synthase in queuosine biosynthesis
MTRNHVIACNGAKSRAKGVRRLDYRADHKPALTLGLPNFIRDVYYLPPRVLDLLEIAAYVYAADRLTSRGRRVAVEYHAWARRFRFVIRVRDLDFWSHAEVRDALAQALRFMTGDLSYVFEFQGGHDTEPTSLFDGPEFHIEARDPMAVVLFSGGVDSLTGVLERLCETTDFLCLVSHQSQSGTARTQNGLVNALVGRFPQRLTHYKFPCTLHDARAHDESQRTRAFLYLSIAFALARAYGQRRVVVYENGVTAINLPRRQDLLNARASRTTHPKTVRLMEALLSQVEGAAFRIDTPFFWSTKTDVIARAVTLGHQPLIASSVSCGKTFQRLDQATHCGVCSQCTDRRLALLGAGAADSDAGGTYAANFISEEVTGEAKTGLVDYLRQAAGFATANVDYFWNEHLPYLIDAAESLGLIEPEAVERLWNLCRRHGEQVMRALRAAREAFDDPAKPAPMGSLLRIVHEREYLKPPVQRFVADVSDRLLAAIPSLFESVRPEDEGDLNDKISGVLAGARIELDREHPVVRFAALRVIPDHSSSAADVWIESKYVRGTTSPSRASHGIAADLTQYRDVTHILFLVYDPEGKVVDREAFKRDFEQTGRCTIVIAR